MTKHRTQVLLDRFQFEVLSRRSVQQGVSVSELIRRLVTREIEGQAKPDLSSICGIVSVPGVSGRDHDSVLYGD